MTNEQQGRHWHGTVGDRYEHHNVWVRGGAPQTFPARRPSLSADGTNMNDRRGSTASDKSSSSSNSSGPPRRGSNLFEGLTNQKRNMADPDMVARRKSWLEQEEKGGFFAKLWDGYTRGH